MQSSSKIKKLLIPFIVILNSMLLGNIGEKKVSFLFEGNRGLFKPAIRSFSQIYGDNNYINGLGLAIGWKSTFLIAKYKQFEVNGKSILSGIDLEGDATWKEEFSILGIRHYDGLLFIEIGYVLNSVKETITTNQPLYLALNSSHSTNKNEGLSIDLGLNVPIGKFLFFADMNYIYVLSSTQYDSDDKKNVGGLMLGLGVTFNL